MYIDDAAQPPPLLQEPRTMGYNAFQVLGCNAAFGCIGRLVQ